MDALPHRYAVSAITEQEGDIVLRHDGLPTLSSHAPAEFDGPGDRWSPETLLVAAVASCYGLTFRGLARKFTLPWRSLNCEAVGVLDRSDRLLQFTSISMRVQLDVPADADLEKASELLRRAEETCLIANSLKAGRHLDFTVTVDA